MPTDRFGLVSRHNPVYTEANTESPLPVGNGEFAFTADFMASYVVYDQIEDRYVLGPPLIPTQENHKAQETCNPTFELAYWSHGLKLAQQWRKRLGMPDDSNWEKVISKLSRPTAINDIYMAHENCPDTFSRLNIDHPSMLGTLGILPGEGIDSRIMLDTLHAVLREWKFDRAWGWDFPMIVMTAARLGEQKLAVDVLLMDAVCVQQSSVCSVGVRPTREKAKAL